MADALASGASGGNIVWVQVPFPALGGAKPNAFSVRVSRFAFCITTSLSPTCKLACEGDLGDCRTPKGFALRCETELKSSRSQPTRFAYVKTAL